MFCFQPTYFLLLMNYIYWEKYFSVSNQARSNAIIIDFTIFLEKNLNYSYFSSQLQSIEKQSRKWMWF